MYFRKTIFTATETFYLSFEGGAIVLITTNRFFSKEKFK